jgi:hypothetical protein
MEKRGQLRYPRRLLHRMGDDDDAEVLAQFIDKLLDARGGDRVERRTGLVHQDHFRIDGNGPGDAQTLLLAAGQAGARMVEAILHFLEQAGLLQARHHDLLEIGLVLGEPMDLRPVGDILIYRFGERIGLLEHHADAGAQLHNVKGLVIDVATVDLDIAGDPAGRDGVVHPVDRAQEGRFPAARGTNEGRNRAVGDIDTQILDGVFVTIIDIDITRLDLQRLFAGDARR